MACAVWPSCHRNSIVRKKRPRRLLPTHDVRPLIDENRKIAIRLDPLRVHRPDDRFGRRADRQPLGQLFAAALRHPRDFGREAFDVLGFSDEQTLRNEEREVGVFVAGRFEPRVEMLLQILPQPEAVGPQHDAAAHRRIRNELGLQADGGVPSGEVGRLRRNLLDDAAQRALRT